MASFDVPSVRGLYVTLGDGWTYLNAHENPLVPERVSVGIARAARSVTAPVRTEDGWVTRADVLRDQARKAVADFVGVAPGQVVLGATVGELYGALVRAMGPLMRHGGSMVLTRGDAHAGGDVRFAQFTDGILDPAQYSKLVNGGTRLVALPAAHPLFGSVQPVGEIVDAARAKSRSWVLIDATAYAPYRRFDMDAWGADIVAMNLGAMGGPDLAALIFRNERMFSRMRNLDVPPVSGILAGGVAPTLTHYTTLFDAGLETRMRELAGDLTTFIGSLPAVEVESVPREWEVGEALDRTPRITFTIKGVPAETIQQRLVDNGMMAGFNADGSITVAAGPYTQNHDIEHLTRVVASLA